MEKYEAPEMEIIEFGSEAVVTTSGYGGQTCPTETESIPITEN